MKYSLYRFKHSPLFQRVLDFKDGNIAPKVQVEATPRPDMR